MLMKKPINRRGMNMFFSFACHESLCLVLAALFILLPPASAQIVTDGTVGPPVSLEGPDYVIGHDMGRRAGSNLFHSFQRFGIAQHESATFTGPDDIANVVSRVTGGEASNIDGLLRSEVGRADFYFVNPAGVVFGENAKVDVPTAFHASTADEVRFADGAVFSASDPGRSTLTVASPESFGFLSPQPASIEVNGSVLEFQPGSAVSLSGGDLSVTGAEESPAGLTVEGGGIRLTATGDAGGQVPVAGGPSSEAARSGSLELDHARLDVMGDGGGTVVLEGGTLNLQGSTVIAENSGSTDAGGGIGIRAGELTLARSSVSTGAWGDGDAGSVEVEVAGSLRLLDGTQILSSASGAGSAGSVTVKAGELRMDGRGSEEITGVASQAAAGTGRAGTVEIEVAGLLEVLRGAQISSGTFTAGDGGSVRVKAGELRMDGGGSEQATGIFNQAASGSAGDGGTVGIEVAGLLELLRGARISTGTRATGDGGSVALKAGGLRIDGGGTGQATGIFTQATSGSAGNGGALDIRVTGTAELLDGGLVSSGASGAGDGGNLLLEAQSLKIDGRGLEELTGIASQVGPESTGAGGTVEVKVAGLLEILDGGAISGGTFGEGDGGDVLIQSGDLRIDRRGSPGGTGVFNQAGSGSGDGGRIEVKVAGLLEIVNGGRITSGAFAEGDAGSVLVEAGELRIDGRGIERVTGILSQANDGAGDGGRIEVRVAGLLEIFDGGLISSGAFAEGDAGSVLVEAGELRIDGREAPWVTGISTRTDEGSGGDAGDVEVKVTGLLEILRGGRITSSTFSTGDAGDVRVQAGRSRIDGGGAEGRFTGVTAQVGEGSAGHGGTVEARVAGLLEVLGGGQISSTTFGEGDAGGVVVSAERIDIQGQGRGSFTGIFGAAASSSSGLAGGVDVRAESIRLSNGGTVSIGHYGEVPSERLEGFQGGVLRIEADSLELQGESEITAQSAGNVPASSVEITVGDKLIVEGSSRITTAAKASDGGSLSVTGPGYALLRDGLITTSTEGGRGGDIVLSPEILILDTGFVQANTAEGAQGGDISAGSQAVIAEGDRLEIGGEERSEFQPGSGLNVIQAAAPRGNPGDIVVTAPEVDVAAALADPGASYVVPARLATDPCLAGSGAGGGSLTLGGRGGVPAGPGESSTPAFRDEDRLDRSLNPDGRRGEGE